MSQVQEQDAGGDQDNAERVAPWDEEMVDVVEDGAEAGAALEPALGRLDARNRLNDLTGREWLYFQNSTWVTRYRRSGADAHAFSLRKEHPSPKPPELLAEIIRFFSKADGKVLDPFAGVGSTLLACSMTGREGVGVELNSQYVEIYRNICAAADGRYREMPLLVGDARHLSQNPQVLIHAPYNLIIADPPYSDMLTRPRTKRTGGAATPFSEEPADIGNIPIDQNTIPPYSDFLIQLRNILAPACKLLTPSGHLIVFCKDLQPTAVHHNLLHADLVVEMATVERMSYRGMRIWANLTPKLYPFGYPFQFVANQVHQYMLVFQLSEK